MSYQAVPGAPVMSELSSFTEYERDFLAISSQLPLRINSVMALTNDNEANADLRKIESDLTQARQRLQDMEIEARGLTEATRREMGSKIRTYKDSLATVAADLKRAKERFSRSALMAGAAGSTGGRPLDFDKSADSRTRMAGTTDKLKAGTNVLNDTHARLEETVSVGEGIMGELHRNRETMTRVRGNVGVVSGALDEARKLLRGMMRREVRTRVALGVFVVVLLAIIIGMIAWAVNRNRS